MRSYNMESFQDGSGRRYGVFLFTVHVASRTVFVMCSISNNLYFSYYEFQANGGNKKFEYRMKVQVDLTLLGL